LYNGRIINAKHKKWTITECSLIKIEIFNTKMRDIDVTTCDLRGLKVLIDDLKGIVVNSSQALMLAQLLEIQIKE
jgi:hypothetical protein